MLSKEKKVIEYFKRQIPKLENTIDWNETFYINPTQSKILRNSLITILNLIDKQQKEIEEKSTIIMAGAEKVKQLEKEIKKYKNVILNLNNNWISKEELKNILEKLKVKEQEMSDEQGYWGGSELQGKIEIIEELLEED